MFKNTFQSGLLSVFHSVGASPLSIWETHVQNGHIKRLTDPDVNSLVLEIIGTNVTTTYMISPKGKNTSLGIRLPFMVMIVKNLKRYFTFEVTILDDRNMRRRFRISNFQSSTKIKTLSTSMPIGLSGGWNQIQLNLCDFTRRAYGTQYLETCRIQINANVRIRRIYFCDRLYTEDELPKDYKLYLPLDKKGKKSDEKITKPQEPEAVKLSKASLTEAVIEGVPEAAPTEETKSIAAESKKDELPGEGGEDAEGDATKSVKSELPDEGDEGAEGKSIATEIGGEGADDAKSVAQSMPGEGGDEGDFTEADEGVLGEGTDIGDGERTEAGDEDDAGADQDAVVEGEKAEGAEEDVVEGGAEGEAIETEKEVEETAEGGEDAGGEVNAEGEVVEVKIVEDEEGAAPTTEEPGDETQAAEAPGE